MIVGAVHACFVPLLSAARLNPDQVEMCLASTAPHYIVPALTAVCGKYCLEVGTLLNFRVMQHGGCAIRMQGRVVVPPPMYSPPFFAYIGESCLLLAEPRQSVVSQLSAQCMYSSLVRPGTWTLSAPKVLFAVHPHVVWHVCDS